MKDQVKLHLLCREMYSKPAKLHAYYHNIFFFRRISEERVQKSENCSHRASHPFLCQLVYLVFPSASLLSILWGTSQLGKLSLYIYTSDMHLASLDILSFRMPQGTYSGDCNSYCGFKWTGKTSLLGDPRC